MHDDQAVSITSNPNPNHGQPEAASEEVVQQQGRYPVDKLVFVPDDIDLSKSPLAGQFDAETFVLGAFNPGLTRLPNGNLLMMVRVAEALKKPIFDAVGLQAVFGRHGLVVVDLDAFQPVGRQFDRQ